MPSLLYHLNAIWKLRLRLQLIPWHEVLPELLTETQMPLRDNEERHLFETGPLS